MKILNSLQLVLVFFSCILSQSSVAQSSGKLSPLDGRLLLSGNFAELRTTHFHGGVDFRTGGVEGLPVQCVDDGIVSRVRISGGGYGNALYVEHADGTTSLYGHLQRYGARLDTIIRKLQYQKESFDLDEDMRGLGIKVKRGEIIAYTGNSGSSGGPHLHYEIRDTRTEAVINPLREYLVEDRIAPKINGVYFYSQSPHGVVGSPSKGVVRPQTATTYTCNKMTLPAGKIGCAVFAIDYTNGSANKLGVYRIVLRANGDTLFEMQFDTVSLVRSELVHAIKDFQLYKQGQTVYRCFGQNQHLLYGIRNKHDGLIELKKDSTVVVEITTSDICGNSSTVKCTLIGAAAIDVPDSADELLSGKRAYMLEAPGFSLRLDSNSLVSAVPYTARVEVDSVPCRRVFVTAEEDQPLLRKARLYFAGTFSEKTVLCLVGKNRWKMPMVTQRDSSGLWCDVRYLGRYTTYEDVQPPVITPLGVSPSRRLQFRIKDNFTGIANFRGEVNGKWCLFVYDAKKNLLSCSLKEPMFLKGQNNRITLVVTDAVGNRAEYKGNVKN